MRFLLLLTIVAGSLAMAACSGDSSVYKTMTVKNRIANFSFEYRAHYKDLDGPYVEDSAAHRFTNVDILAPKKERAVSNPAPGIGDTVNMQYVPAFIEIMAADTSKYPGQTPEVRINEAFSDWSKWPNFKLLERTTETLSGNQVHVIAYLIDGSFRNWPLEYRIQAAFDQGSLQWDIKATARDPELADAVRADFDHVLQTLRILK